MASGQAESVTLDFAVFVEMVEDYLRLSPSDRIFKLEILRTSNAFGGPLVFGQLSVACQSACYRLMLSDRQ